ncbi:MAG: hypothetical protein WCJ72_15770 [Chryseobacterium sp.]
MVKETTTTLALIEHLFELIFPGFGSGGKAAAAKTWKNSECGKQEKASNKNAF